METNFSTHSVALTTKLKINRRKYIKTRKETTKQTNWSR